MDDAVSYFMVDVEADGPIPGRYSMVAIGAVVVQPGLQRTFYCRLRPISEQFVPSALAVSGFSRADTLGFPDAGESAEPRGTPLGEDPFGRSSDGPGVLPALAAKHEGRPYRQSDSAVGWDRGERLGRRFTVAFAAPTSYRLAPVWQGFPGSKSYSRRWLPTTGTGLGLQR